MKTRRKHQQHQTRSASRPCHHALSRGIHAFKHCILNYECYHCAYDQWLDEIDFEAPPKKMETASCQASLSVAA